MFKVGDWVRVEREWKRETWGEDPLPRYHIPNVGAVGKIIVIDKELGLPYGVDFMVPFVGGHGCGMDRQEHQWSCQWLPERVLELVPTMDVPASLHPSSKPSDREAMVRQLKATYPYGHSDFIPTILEQVELHNNKNHDYARGGDSLGNFKRVASILAAYWPDVFGGEKGPAVLAFIYALKQVDAEGWQYAQGGESKVEGVKGRLMDQAVYANIRLCMHKDKEKV